MEDIFWRQKSLSLLNGIKKRTISNCEMLSATSHQDAAFALETCKFRKRGMKKNCRDFLLKNIGCFPEAKSCYFRRKKQLIAA